MTLRFIYTFECIISKVQENHKRLELNETHQVLVHTDDANLLEKNVNSIKTLISHHLPVFVLHVSETLSLSLREKHELRVFENKILKKIKRQEVYGVWRELHTEELSV